MRLHEAEEELDELLERCDEDDPQARELRREIHQLREKASNIPFLDPFDLRYNNRARVPNPPARR